MPRSRSAFSLIELLIVIFIIGLLTTLLTVAFSNITRGARDQRRVADILKIQQALEAYHRDQGAYPASLVFGASLVGSSTGASASRTYLETIPTNIAPRNDGICPDQEYIYTRLDPNNYSLLFCISTPADKVAGGFNTAFKDGIKYGGLVGWWNFDEGVSTTTVLDRSGNGNNATWHGTGNPHYMNGPNGGYVGKLNGTASADYLDMGDSNILDFGANDFTASMWVNKLQTSVGNGDKNCLGIGKWNTGGFLGTNEWDLILCTGTANDMPSFVLESGAASFKMAAATSSLTIGQWYHITGVRSGQYLKIYVNGAVASSTLVGSIPMNIVPGRKFMVGQIAGASIYTNAYFDDIRLYNRALSDSEVNWLYSSTVANYSGFVACSSDAQCTGNQACVSNSCTSSITYGGQVYNIIKINTQYWLSSNLNIGNVIAGANNPSSDTRIEKYCYGDSLTNCTTYGGLYTWYEAMQLPASCYSGTQVDCTANPTDPCCATSNHDICPTGWHIPSDAEQNTLDQYLTDNGQTCNAGRNNTWDCANAGTKLKTGGTSGFNALMAGYRGTDGLFHYQGTYPIVALWSSSVSGVAVWNRTLRSDYVTVGRAANSMVYGFSVRCIKG